MIQYRPLMTGDVLELGDGQRLALVQHPCSMRRGDILNPRLLVAEVREWNAGIPSDWNKHVRRMFLPEMAGETDWAIEFDSIELLDSSTALAANRIAVLSQHGVNLLVQRWVHHLARVAVPTATINKMISGQFEEVDLIGEGIDDLVSAGLESDNARTLISQWLDEKQSGQSRRTSLNDPQRRSTVRSELRRAVRGWSRP